MAVVTLYGTGYKNPASVVAIAAVNAEGMPRDVASKVAIANGNSSTSLVLFGRAPSSAILRPSSTLYFTAITGLTSFSLGFGKDGAIVNSKAAALMSAVNVAAGGAFSAVSALTAGVDYTKPIWQLAGYTTDPGGMIDFIGTLGANAGANGTVEAFLGFLKGA